MNDSTPVLRAGERWRFHDGLTELARKWTNPTGGRAIYGALKPNRDFSHASAVASRGEWTEVFRLPARVQPSFSQTEWCRRSGLLLLIGASAVAICWQIQSNRLRHLAKLEGELQAERARIGRVCLLGNLSASLAHELNQPLTAILSSAQAALRFVNDEPANLDEVRAGLKEIAESNRRASEIIQRIYAMMKKGEPRMERRDINGDVEQVLLLLQGELKMRNVTVATHLMGGMPAVHGDHIQLQQVLLNLIVNGCDAIRDFPPEERRLLITTKHAAEKLVHVSVKDRGAGIRPELLDQIFTAFYSTKAGGLGMGLSISRAIINAHGGLLWAANNPDRGTTFHFTLRLGEPKKA